MTTVTHELRARILEPVLANLVREFPAGDVSTDRLWEAVNAAVQGVELGARRRHTTRQLTQFAGTYLGLFIPGNGWRLVTEGSDALEWERDGVRMGDAIVARTSNASSNRSDDFRAARAQLRQGRSSHGQDYAGVRIIFPAKPAASRWMIGTRREARPLAGSGFWTRHVDAAQLRVALLGGAS